MTVTFNPDLGTAIDRIRQRIGDADTTNAQVQNETITAYLAVTGKTELEVARQLCLDLAAKWARFATTTLDDQQQRSETIHKHYLTLAEAIMGEIRLTASNPTSTGGITVGGLDDCRGPIDPWPYYGGFVVGIPRTGP